MFQSPQPKSTPPHEMAECQNCREKRIAKELPLMEKVALPEVTRNLKLKVLVCPACDGLKL